MSASTNFQQLAAYNHWANARIYAAAWDLPDELYRRPVGVFFGSLHGTLNHLLVTDRIWLHRLTGQGPSPDRLNAILFDDLRALTEARIAEDMRLRDVVAGHTDTKVAETIAYANMSGQQHTQKRGDVLLHLFNHQTHHRGHAHACLSIVTGKEPPSLDMVVFQRGGTAPEWTSMLQR